MPSLFKNTAMPPQNLNLYTNPPEDMEKMLLETRDYIWKYWSFHADQRLKTFNFFVLLVSVLVAGTLAYFKDAVYPLYALPVGIILILISYAFWRLDCRNRVLIKHAEKLLVKIELKISHESLPDNLRLINSEHIETEKLRRMHKNRFVFFRWPQAPLSFYNVFCFVFILFSLLGAAVIVGSIFLPSNIKPVSKDGPQRTSPSDDPPIHQIKPHNPPHPLSPHRSHPALLSPNGWA